MPPVYRKAGEYKEHKEYEAMKNWRRVPPAVGPKSA
jgi:hypothetical protein